MSRRVRKVRLAVVAGAGLCLAGWWLYQWWYRPPAVEFDNLKYIQLLRTAVSAQRDDYLAGVERAIQQRCREDAMSPAEARHFPGIISIARQGAWDRAQRMAYEFELSQANRQRKLSRVSAAHREL
jgi:hypothetical protein